ncbi:hypothetical protein L596_008487 [Steinernema carpocapsae]|uniref:Nucleoporin NDC1 n=1 Tax=Steinernema carpocapsae TaxID=34508 RepID=A0A4U5PD55_STECR|nr:hypothetical protein L596_008487 [Steinernema carpocapsae]
MPVKPISNMIMFSREFANPKGPSAPEYLEHHASFDGPLGSPIGNSTEISPALRQRGCIGPANDNAIGATRRLAAPNTSCSAKSAESVLSDWFYAKMDQRRNYALIGSILASSTIFTILTFILQLSLFHPFKSFADGVLSFFSLRWTILIITHSALVAVLCYIWNFLMLKVEGNNRLSKYERGNWVIFFCIASCEVLLNMIFWCSCLVGWGTTDSVFSAYVFMVLVSCKISYDQLFNSSFRLTQPLKEVNIKADLYSMMEIRSDPLYRKAALSCLRAYKRAVWIYILLTAMFPLSLWNLLNYRLLFVYIIMAFRQQVGFAVAYRLNRIFLTQNIEFPMPLTYTMKDPTEEELRNISLALYSNDFTIQFFAFWDLKKLSSCDAARRVSIYGLSQPGGHPRNWNQISRACMDAVKRATLRIDDQNKDIRLKDIRELSEHIVLDSSAAREGNLEIDRNAMMLPPDLRLSMHRESARLRREYAISGRRFHYIRSFPLVAKIEKLVLNIVDWFAEKKKVVTDFEADRAHCAIDCLRSLVQFSVKEDRYGVVQKDLDKVFACLLELYNVSDANIRAKRLNSTHLPVADSVRNFNQGLLKLQNGTSAAITRLAAQFKVHLPALNLSQHLRDTLQQVI